MKDKVFLDTNIFVYFFDRANSKKRSIARNLIKEQERNGLAVISFQVVQEFCNLATGKFKSNFEQEDISIFTKNLMYPYCEIFPSFGLFDHALNIHYNHKYGFYDSLIIASAIDSNCKILYSEDLQHGQVIKGVEIINPFLKL